MGNLLKYIAHIQEVEAEEQYNLASNHRTKLWTQRLSTQRNHAQTKLQNKKQRINRKKPHFWEKSKPRKSSQHHNQQNPSPE